MRYLLDSNAMIELLNTPASPLARARGLTLISHNLREFQRVPGLRVESCGNRNGKLRFA